MRKYRNKPCTGHDFFEELAGRRFDSKLERERATELVMLKRGGEIRNLEFQKSIKLTRAEISYRADFHYEERTTRGDWLPITEDSKGMETERWRIIKALWRVYGPNKLRVTARKGSRIATIKEIQPD